MFKQGEEKTIFKEEKSWKTTICLPPSVSPSPKEKQMGKTLCGAYHIFLPPICLRVNFPSPQVHWVKLSFISPSACVLKAFPACPRAEERREAEKAEKLNLIANNKMDQEESCSRVSGENNLFCLMSRVAKDEHVMASPFL